MEVGTNEHRKEEVNRRHKPIPKNFYGGDKL
jgi:hypothetical protein